MAALVCGYFIEIGWARRYNLMTRRMDLLGVESKKMTTRRLSTGIPGLDQVTMGGLIPRHAYVLVGNPGTGKTILSLQWLLEGVKCGEKGIFISMVEEPKMLKKNAESLGWDLAPIEITDFSVAAVGDMDEFEEYHVFPPSEVENAPVWKKICEIVEKKKPQRLVIDSITQLRQFSTDEYQFRRHIFVLIRFLTQQACTAVFSCEPLFMEEDTSISSAVDGIIYLEKEISRERLIDIRNIHIQKFRGSDFLPGAHPMRITSRGVEIFPHIIEKNREVQHAGEQIRSQIPELDNLLGGGIESGTTTIISGPSGTGKSTLALQFLMQAALAEKRAILYSFEETTESILFRSRSVGMEVMPLLEKGLLEIRYVNPLELYPDEFLQTIRLSVGKEGYNVAAFDSLKGYHMTMEEFGSTVAHLQNVITFLKAQGTTVFMINETERITGDLRMTEAGISFLADNIILLRYIEQMGRIGRVIGCVKKRLGAPQTELRELILSSKGIQVGKKLDNFVGVLTGIPAIRDKWPEEHKE